MSEHLRLRPDAVAWREVDGEVIALGLESSTYFGTNSSGAILWRRLAEGTTRAELVNRLAAAAVRRLGAPRPHALDQSHGCRRGTLRADGLFVHAGLARRKESRLIYSSVCSGVGA